MIFPEAKMGDRSKLLLELWRENQGQLSLVSFSDAVDSRFATLFQAMLLFRIEDQKVKTSFLGEEILRREAGSDAGLASDYLDLQPDGERQRAWEMFKEARERRCAVVGSIERLPIQGFDRFRRAFLMLPICAPDTDSMFVSVDDDWDCRKDLLPDTSDGSKLKPGQTMFLEYEFLDIPDCE